MTSCGEQWKPPVLMVAINFAFAIVNILLKKILDEGTNQMVIVTYRLAVSTLFLAPIAFFLERNSRPKLTVWILCRLFISSLFGLTMTQYFFIVGLKYTSATFSCAFLNTVPVKTFILSVLFGVEKVNLNSKAGKAKVLGALICMCGAILLTIYKGIPLTNAHYEATNMMNNYGHTMVSDKKTQRWILGSILLIVACFSWSSWFLMQAKVGKVYPCQYSSTAIFSFFGVIQSVIISLIIERNISAWILKGKLEIITIIYSGMVGSGLCYVGLSWCVKKRGPVFTSAFTPFTQIFAAFFDISFLHEPLYLGSVIGSVIVVVGLYVLLWGKSKDAEECAVKSSQIEAMEESCVAELQLPVTINSTSK